MIEGTDPFGFKSDFKIIADYFVKRRKILEYRGSKDTIKHVDEFFKLMKILTNDNEIETVYNESIFTEQGGADMTGYFTTLINEGKLEGKLEGKAELIQKIIKNGNMSIGQIATLLELPVEKVKELSQMELASA